jgi:hypothetical protein
MQKIVINDEAGGFDLSGKAIILARLLSGNPQWQDAIIEGELYPENPSKVAKYTHVSRMSDKRDDVILVKIVEILGSKEASGEHAKLKIVQVPAGINWKIIECDNGYEYIEEKHRTWS